MDPAIVLITEVGRAFTVTIAIPVLSPTLAVQFASLNAVTVYEVEAAVGDTNNV